MGNGILTASAIVGTIAMGVTAALLSRDKSKKASGNTVRSNFTPDAINNSNDEEEAFTNDEDFDFDVKKGRVTLVSYNGSDKIVRIPDIVNEIADSAFEDCSAEIIEIPEEVEKIGDSAFCGCKNLKSITMPFRMKKLGAYAFKGCEALEVMEVPEDIDIIGEETFADCTSLAEITLPHSLKIIEDSAFSGCENLAEIEIPDSVKSIGENAFGGCTSLEDVYLPDGIDNLGENDEDSDVFDGCENISVEYDGNTYRYGQLKSLYIRVNCQ